MLAFVGQRWPSIVAPSAVHEPQHGHDRSLERTVVEDILDAAANANRCILYQLKGILQNTNGQILGLIILQFDYPLLRLDLPVFDFNFV